ncbi:hypothetical protein O7600_09270 [Micromonospora sp. WMMA1998]|uniref:hypothetical protein n=1 Tax=Micromonospora sp. WMMA1998 TaxID=3015167 RepID=UPI00248B00F1|nr:hypothetical protein [Micromonospora sp. WMMA1998]WBC16999.1 hypothetical protein O7600_09270 [Micromonospora sp. WMMA1998]
MSTGTCPHLPLRPLWICKRCAQPWPCAVARLALVAEYGADRVGLAVYLCGQLYDAAQDLHRLNPVEAPGPQALFARFVGWAPLRSPPALQ